MYLLKRLNKLPKLLFVILAFVFCLNFYLATLDSQTIDEGAHLAAGYSYVTTGDYRLNPEHPALFKLLAGTAILPLNTKPAKELNGWAEANQWPAGKDLIYNSRSSSRQILLLARLPSILITVTLVYAVFLLARRFGGEKVGLLAAGLFALDPTLNGHGHLITNDVLLALGSVAFLLGALNYWAKPTKKHLVLFTLATLLVISAKFSGLVLVPIAAIIVIVKLWKQKKRLAKHLLAAIFILFFGVWMQYGFKVRSFDQDLVLSPPGDRLVEQASEFKASHPGLAWLYSLKVPAYPYIRGIATLKLHNSDGHPSYLFGNRDRYGSLFYFPVALSIKLPEVVIAGALASLCFVLLRRLGGKKELRRNLVVLLSIAGLFIGLGIVSKINIGVRHIFAAWPFLYVASALVFYRLHKARGGKYYVLLLFLMIPTIIATFRTPLAYQNEVGRGIERIANKPILIDSNRDWSQDLYRLNDYLNEHGAMVFGEALFNNTDMNDIFSGKEICTLGYYDPECWSGVAPPCLLAISDTALLTEDTKHYQWALDSYDLIDRVGGSISIYRCRD
ncbi:MAG: glycosyltransferase family 39 protein [Patescibacteria group bacterium]